MLPFIVTMPSAASVRALVAALGAGDAAAKVRAAKALAGLAVTDAVRGTLYSTASSPKSAPVATRTGSDASDA